MSKTLAELEYHCLASAVCICGVKLTGSHWSRCKRYNKKVLELADIPDKLTRCDWPSRSLPPEDCCYGR